jgi:hypothetical protein
MAAIDARHRDKNGEISKKHGNTLIRTLRKHYGQNFAKGCSDDEKLSDVLHKLDEPSLSHLIRDHDVGKLEQIVADKGAGSISTKAQRAGAPDPGSDEIFKELPQARVRRPQLRKALDSLAPGDELVIAEWDRATRSMWACKY